MLAHRLDRGPGKSAHRRAAAALARSGRARLVRLHHLLDFDHEPDRRRGRHRASLCDFCARLGRNVMVVGTLFTGPVGSSSAVRWFSSGWPASWNVIWTVVSTTPVVGAPQVE